jgi:hypothetical protein
MRRTCKLVIGLFFGLYLMALALLAMGTWGLFGQPRDPLSGAFLLPLGLPWNRMLGGFPDGWLPGLAAAAPLVNLAVILILCRLAAGRNRP